jgi:transcriptional regulator with GAF, ATPase, and Fis domain
VNSQFPTISQELDMATPSLSRYTPSGWSIGVPQELLLLLYERTMVAGDLEGVLAAITDVLLPILPFTSLSIFSFNEGRLQLRGAHVVGLNTPVKLTIGESRRQLRPVDSSNASREKLPYDVAELKRRLSSGKPFACPDLLAKERWYEHEFRLAAGGVRAYASLPLMFREETVGAAIFSRFEPQAFTAEELIILRSVSAAIGAAVARAMQFDEMVERCAQLEDENLELRSQVAQSLASDEPEDSFTTTSPADGFIFLRERMEDTSPRGLQPTQQSTNISARLNQEECRLIEATLHATRGRISGPKGAAVRLGLAASTLEFRIHRLGIDKFVYRRSPEQQPTCER